MKSTEVGYNTGHFEKGVWIPDCNMCGACCRYLFWIRNREDEQEEYIRLDSYMGVKKIGNVLYIPATCRFLGPDNKCTIHEEDRPDCCHRFGYGGYHHPSVCAFFGGETDEEYYPDDYRHKLAKS